MSGSAAGRTVGTGSQGQHPRRVVEGDVCWFCLKPADPSIPGRLAVLHKTNPTLFGGHTILYHEACVGYCNTDRNGVLQAAIDARHDKEHVLKDREVVAAWGRCQHLPCAVCNQLGASIICCSGGCGWMMHFPCARLSAQGKLVPKQLPSWPPGRAVFAEDRREVACPDHGNRVANPIAEPQGDWFEACGGWNSRSSEAQEAWDRGHQQKGKAAAGSSKGTLAAAGSGRVAPEAAAAAAPTAQGTQPGASAGRRPGPQQPQQPQQQKVIIGLWQKSKVRLVGGAGSAGPPSGSAPAGGSMPAAPNGLGSGGPRSAATGAAAAPVLVSSGARAGSSSQAAMGMSGGPGQAQERQQQQQEQQQQHEGDGGPLQRQWHIPGHEWEWGGYITRPVPLRTGEKRVLSHTLDAPRAEEYDKVQQAFKFRFGKTRNAMRHIKYVGERQLPDTTLKQVERAIYQYVGSFCPGGKFSVDKLPEDILAYAGGEVFPIPEGDPRVGMAGKPDALGWRNRHDSPTVPIYTVLGAYQCLQLKNTDLRRMREDEQLVAKMGCRSKPGLDVLLESYVADSEAKGHPECDDEYAQEYRQLYLENAPLGELHILSYSALGYGNETALINTGHKDPLGELKKDAKELTKAIEDNCALVEVLIGGWPFLFVVTNREIAPGEEFILDYGDLYWANLYLYMRAQHDFEQMQQQIMDAMMQQMQQMQHNARSGEQPVPQLTGNHPLATEASGVHAAGGGVGRDAEACTSADGRSSRGRGGMAPPPPRALSRLVRQGSVGAAGHESGLPSPKQEAPNLCIGPTQEQAAVDDASPSTEPASSEPSGVPPGAPQVPPSPLAAAAAVAAAAAAAGAGTPAKAQRGEQEDSSEVQQASSELTVPVEEEGSEGSGLARVFSSPVTSPAAALQRDRQQQQRPASAAAAHRERQPARGSGRASRESCERGRGRGGGASSRRSGSRSRSRSQSPISRLQSRGGTARRPSLRERAGGALSPRHSTELPSPRDRSQLPSPRELPSPRDRARVLSPVDSKGGRDSRGRPRERRPSPPRGRSQQQQQRRQRKPSPPLLLIAKRREQGEKRSREPESRSPSPVRGSSERGRRRDRGRSHSRERSREAKRLAKLQSRGQHPAAQQPAAQQQQQQQQGNGSAPGTLPAAQAAAPSQPALAPQQAQRQESAPAHTDSTLPGPSAMRQSPFQSYPQPAPHAAGPLAAAPAAALHHSHSSAQHSFQQPHYHHQQQQQQQQPFTAASVPQQAHAPMAWPAGGSSMGAAHTWPQQPAAQPAAAAPMPGAFTAAASSPFAAAAAAVQPEATLALEEGDFEMPSPPDSPSHSGGGGWGAGQPAGLQGGASIGAAPAPSAPAALGGALGSVAYSAAHPQPLAPLAATEPSFPLGHQPGVPLSEWDHSPPASPRAAAAGGGEEGGDTPDLADLLPLEVPPLEVQREGTPDMDEQGTPDHLEGPGFPDLLDGQGLSAWRDEPDTPDLADLDLPPPPPHLNLPPYLPQQFGSGGLEGPAANQQHGFGP